MSDWYSELPPAGESYPVKKRRKRRSAKAWVIAHRRGGRLRRLHVRRVHRRQSDARLAAGQGGRDDLHDRWPASVKVTISPGMTATQIGQLLEDKGVISSASAFVDLVDSRGSEDKLQPGTYTFSTKSQLIAVVDKLEKGQGSDHLQGHHPRGSGCQPDSRPTGQGRYRQECGHVCGAQSSSPTSSSCRRSAGSTQKVTTLEGLLFPDTYNLHGGRRPHGTDRRATRGFQQEDRVAALEQGRGAGADSVPDRHRGVADREGSQHRRRIGRRWRPSSTTASRRR